MPDGFVIANFRHVGDGLQEGQFAVSERKRAASLNDLDPIYRQLLDRPITQTLGIIGPDGRPSLTPMWFDYEDDKILVNTASHRPKCQWIRRNPRMTSLLVNPDNPYHWVQIKHSVDKELREWDPGGEYVTRQLDLIWSKYTGNPPPYGLATLRSTRSACCLSAAWCRDRTLELQREFDDTAAELMLRGEEPPFDAVRDETAALADETARDVSTQGGRRQSTVERTDQGTVDAGSRMPAIEKSP